MNVEGIGAVASVQVFGAREQTTPVMWDSAGGIVVGAAFDGVDQIQLLPIQLIVRSCRRSVGKCSIRSPRLYPRSLLVRNRALGFGGLVP